MWICLKKIRTGNFLPSSQREVGSVDQLLIIIAGELLVALKQRHQADCGHTEHAAVHRSWSQAQLEERVLAAHVLVVQDNV